MQLRPVRYSTLILADHETRPGRMLVNDVAPPYVLKRLHEMGWGVDPAIMGKTTG